MSTQKAKWAGVSALALAAFGGVGTGSAFACEATSNFTVVGGTVYNTNSVTVDCPVTPPTDTALFNTNFTGSSSTSFAIVSDYDGSGADTLNLLGGTIANGSNNLTPEVTNLPSFTALNPETDDIHTLGGNDVVTVSGTVVDGGLDLGEGNDSVTMTAGSLLGIAGREGNDTIDVSGGTVGPIYGDGNLGVQGNDTIYVSGGLNNGTVFAGGGNDTVGISGTAQIGISPGEIDSVGLEDGDDTFVMTGGRLQGGVSGGAGIDSLALSGGSVDFVAAGTGNDTVSLSGTIAVADVVTAEDGDDTVSIAGGTVGNFVDLGAGNDRFVMSGGTVANYVFAGVGDDTMNISGGTIGSGIAGGDGNDTVAVSGGTVNGNITGDSGTDLVSVSGGTITGGIDAETVHLFGGTIGGDITGISGNTLLIQSGTALTLRDGVGFQGTNAVAVITASDLARSSGNGAFQSQVFNGFTSVGLDGSTVGFRANQGIAALSLANGSTLYASGQASLLSPSGGFGSLSLTNSTISFINGTPTDQFTVGNLSLNNATIAIDVNQSTSQSDRLTTTGTFNAAGANVVQINLIGTPQFGTITIVPVGGEQVPTSGTGSPLFTVIGVPDSASSLFSYQIINGANGGLYLLSQATDIGAPNATRAAIDAMPLETVTRSMLDISNDAIVTELGLAVSASRADAAPAFGIYASGQLAHVEHDGFDVSGPGFNGTGPSFSSNDFSLAASVELDAAKYWGFDNQYGLNIGLFGGYASTDVKMDPTALFSDVGNASNDSGMIGTYGLFRQNTSYALVAATGFFGQTDINNGVVNSTGDYGTAGYAVTGSVGRIFALNERLRFDMRGGLLGVTFEGDPYTDSVGVTYGRSRVSFGAVKFEPGIYGDFKLDNGMVASPYARMELQQRFGYSNTGSVQDVDLEFDDADFSASFSGGVNVQVAPKTTLSGEVRTKLSADSQTFAGKLGLKVKF